MNSRTMFAFLCAILVLSAMPAMGQTVQFTHHGNIGFSANGNNYDIQLTLFDASTVGTGTQHGATFQQLGVQMTDGEFAVQPDFGAGVFTGAELYLETGWRVSGGGTFTVLPSREKMTAVYANRSLSAATADSASNSIQLGGLPPSSFIQNTSSQQSGSFHVSGDGTAGGTLSGNTVNAATQFSLGGSSVLSNQGIQNMFAGIGAGGLNTTGNHNAFFGFYAGGANTAGEFNSFFGYAAGFNNKTGRDNAFFGAATGGSNTDGSNNSFFGGDAGVLNTIGSNNAFFGRGAGNGNTTGSSNAFFGSSAGERTGKENENTFIGAFAGSRTGQADVNSLAHFNTFVGSSAGVKNETGSRNTIVGAKADFATNNLNNATAIGANAYVTQNNSLVLGSISGVNGGTADTRVGIGTTAPGFKLHVSDPSNSGLRVETGGNGGTVASFGGNGDFQIDAPGVFGGRFTVLQSGKVGVGTGLPGFKLHVIDSSNTGLRVQTNATGGTVASFGGNGAFQIDAPGLQGGRFAVDEAGNTGLGTGAPFDRLDVRGTIRISSLASQGFTALCRNASNQIATCSSSIRYKHNIEPFVPGLDLLTRLTPVTFDWKSNGQHDLGLVAEDVAKIEPLLVTHNEKGEVEGVKYDRVSVVLLNAIKEQQAQIESLKRIVCLDHPDAEICSVAARTIRVSQNK